MSHPEFDAIGKDLWFNFLLKNFSNLPSSQKLDTFRLAFRNLPPLTDSIVASVKEEVEKSLKQLAGNLDENRYKIALLLSIIGHKSLAPDLKHQLEIYDEIVLPQGSQFSTKLSDSPIQPKGTFLCPEAETFMSHAITNGENRIAYDCLHTKRVTKATGLCFNTVAFDNDSCVIRGIWYRCANDSDLDIALQNENQKHISPNGVWIPARSFLNAETLSSQGRANLIDSFMTGTNRQRFELINKFGC